MSRTRQTDVKTKRILLVDDDPLGVELALAALEEAGLADQVAVAQDGVDAMAYLHDVTAQSGCGPLPMVMLLDLKMPRMDGFQVLERVRGSEPLRMLPVVMLSSSREESDKHRSYDLGANAYVAKPVDFEEFKATVRRIGQFWTEVNQPPPLTGTEN